MPDWQQRSIERSLKNVRVRVQDRHDRFVAAAIDLLSERDESDFTIQDVVERSAMSLGTFYSYFDGKVSLMLAVYETILRRTAMPLLRERCDREKDPVLRTKALLYGMVELASVPSRLSRALSVFHLRLAETRPDDLRQALEPLHLFIVELLTEVAAAERLRDDVGLDTQAALLQELLLSTTHFTVLAGLPHTSADDLWTFCSSAILSPPRKRRGGA
ncbi:TetR/AcrR family transcriptional regulator [Nocardia sp. NBC_00565]|uniref:TetR/AcrR family transcriptional regulator n=1 Tax=Nocardia sp. NBC_00565 TaxID=2975993 RepID=UPI002E7FEEA3|nr:TetR/AcrR family transcriptional regulator [Nocardia sp. NBC_00565]WUC05590.1 TetR/AcrR family transcriptional regulator [Nocardia sp. NBC_00565]